MLSHANMQLGAVSVAHYLRLTAEDRVLAVLPFSFDYGQNQLFSTWAAGGCVVPLDYLTARDVVRAVETHQDQHFGWCSSALGAIDRNALAGRGGALAASADQ